MAEPNYNESTVSGTTWQRCNTVTITNGYNSTPMMYMGEEKITMLDGGEVIARGCGGLALQFNPTNEKHMQLYTLLNEFYVELRTARDSQPTPVEPPVEEPI